MGGRQHACEKSGFPPRAAALARELASAAAVLRHPILLHQWAI